MSHVDALTWSERPKLRRPILACAFKGWNDAGESATAATSFLRESLGATDVAEIDPEEFFDFTAVRPTVTLADSSVRTIEWPTTNLYAAHVPGAESDLVLLEGAEPSLRWRAFSGLVIEAARELEARMVITLGALLADVPHSRPVSITGLASEPSLIERLGLARASYEGPTGIVGVLHDACARAGLPSASLWASVPHYVAAAPNPKAALALIRSFEGLTGVAVDASSLEEASEDYDRQVSAAVASDPEVKAFVERLEETLDEAGDAAPPAHIPSGETIAHDFQRFLRQQPPSDAR